MLGKTLSGCGCVAFLSVLLIVAFLAGAQYGQQVKKAVATHAVHAIVQTKAGITEIDRRIKEAQTAADTLSESSDNKNSFSNRNQEPKRKP